MRVYLSIDTGVDYGYGEECHCYPTLEIKVWRTRAEAEKVGWATIPCELKDVPVEASVEVPLKAAKYNRWALTHRAWANRVRRHLKQEPLPKEWK